MPKKQIRAYLLQNKDRPGAGPELREALEMLDKVPDDVLMDALKRTLVELAKRGVLIPWLMKTGAIERRVDEDDEE